jgi:hypothetical protein
MRMLLMALAAATILIAGSAMSRSNAATIIDVGSLAPLTKNHTSVEKTGYWRRCYRRGRCGYYGYYRPYPYYSYGYYRPYYGYRYRWRY